MKGKIKKALSIFLAMCAISTVFQLSSYSVDADSAPVASGGGTASESSYVMEMTEDGEKLRLTEEEPNLRTKIYLNRDGTKSMEVYDDPVKYVASDGLIKDKLLTIEATAGGFISAQSDIECRFSADISRGIGIRRGAVAVMMLPDDAVDGTAVLSTDGKEVTYLVDDSTVYRYSLTYTGYKEEIIVSEYTGQTKYVFRYLTDGLSLEQTGDCYGFVDGNGEVKATLSEILIFTADDRNNRVGDMSVETVRANEEYVVTLELDENYLSDPLTAYPLIIDPSIDITYENSGADAIEDATINSAAGTSGSGTTLNVGLRSSYGIARILVKFPGLDLSPIASADNIVSARFRVRDLMCYSTHLPVNCHVFKSAWTENTVNWSSTNPNNYNSQVLDTLTVYYNNGNHVGEGYTHSNIYEFNVLQAVKGWKSGTYNQNAGIMLKTTAAIENGSNNISVVFASYERNTNKPKLFVTYEEGINKLYTTNIVLDKGKSDAMVYSTTSGTTVNFTSSNTSVATVTATGVVEGNAYGMATVTAKFYRNGAVIKTMTCTVFVGQERYILFKSDGACLSAYNTLLQSYKFYTTSDIIKSWIFIPTGGYNEYYIIQRYGANCAITASPSTQGVTLSNWIKNEEQRWVIYTSGGIRLKTNSTNQSIVGTYLYRKNDGSFALSSGITYLGLPFVNSLVPATGMTFSNLLFPITTSARYVYPTVTPSNATYGSGSGWLKFTSSNNSVVSFNDPDKPNYMTINGIGRATITVTHPVYGLTATGTVTIYDPTNYYTELDENKVYYIRSGSKYMEIPSDPEASTDYGKGLDDFCNVAASQYNTQYSHQMWRFARYGTTSYYVICNMHSDNQVLYRQTDSLIVAYTTNSSTYGTAYQDNLPDGALWGIEYNESTRKFKIVPANDPSKSLYISSDNSIKAASSSGIANSGFSWNIEYFDSSFYWGGKCCTALKPMDVVIAVDLNNSGTYRIDTIPWETSLFSFDKIKQAVEMWNGITSRVNITCKKLEEVTSDDVVMSVIVNSEFDVLIAGVGAWGATYPIINGEEVNGTDDKMGDNWNSSVIYLTTSILQMPGDNVSYSARVMQEVIIHEVGHALKLEHIISEEKFNHDQSLGYRKTLPSIMGETRVEESSDNYLDSLNYIASRYITNYDKADLINKWESLVS